VFETSIGADTREAAGGIIAWIRTYWCVMIIERSLKDQICATSAGHVAGTEAMTSRKKITRKSGSDHSRDQDVEGNMQRQSQDIG